MALDQNIVQRIIDTADIQDVVSDYVTLKKRGVNYIGLCPFHEDTTPSFYVSPSKGICKCFSCGEGGNAVHFLMKLEKCNFQEAIRMLGKKYNIEIPEREMTKEQQQAQDDRESMLILNAFARDYFQNTLRNTEDGRAIGMAYCRNRGFREDIIDKFQIGYSTDHRYALALEAEKKGYKKEYLLKTGLCYENDDHKLRDRFWGRIIFPIHSLAGKVVGFGGRVLSAQTKGITAKYVNSPESEIYHKSNILYGIFFAKKAIQTLNCCYIVEGYTDVISMHQAGIENVVAPSGTAFTESQITNIHRLTSNVTLLFDGDEAGIKAALKSINPLLAAGMNTKICLLPEDEDPDPFARKHSASEVKEYIDTNALDCIRFKLKLLQKEVGNDPIKRAELISDLVGSIAVIPEAIVRDVYIKECGQLLQMADSLLVAEVAKKRTALAEAKQKDQEVKARQIERRGGSGEAMPTPQQPNPISPVPTTSPIPQPVVAQGAKTSGYKFFKYEQLIIQSIIRYGEKVMCQVEEEDGSQVDMRVIEYVVSDLTEDELAFEVPIHKQILEEAMSHLNDTGFVAERYFINHPDPEISRVALELAADRYQLSKVHSKTQTVITDEERLHELVPILMINYKNAVVAEELKGILNQLKDPVVGNNEEKFAELMERYKQLKDIERIMVKHLGDRVVLR